jgi:2,3-dihydroxybenzoate-AMP ligase
MYLTTAVHNGFDHREVARTVRDIRPDLSVVIDGECDEFVGLDELGAPRAKASEHVAQPSELALRQLSGGTTGAPKLVPRTHADYYYSVRASAEICRITPESVMLVALPATHNFPISSPGWLGALHAGATVELATDPSPHVCFELIERLRVTIAAVVPPLGRVWAAAAQSNTRDLTWLGCDRTGTSS